QPRTDRPLADTRHQRSRPRHRHQAATDSHRAHRPATRPTTHDDPMTTITSFAYRAKRTPRADVVIDCRGLPNPADQPWMRRLNGHDPRVADHVLAHPDAQRIVETAVEQATLGATSI